MNGRCAVCQNPARQQIDSSIMAGLSFNEIGRTFSVSRFSVQRHKRNCLNAAREPESLQGQLNLWLKRANELFLTSGASADARGQAQALTAAFRGLEFALKHQEIESQKARDLPSATAEWTNEEADKFRAYLDSIIMDASRTPYASEAAKTLGRQIELEGTPQ